MHTEFKHSIYNSNANAVQRIHRPESYHDDSTVAFATIDVDRICNELSGQTRLVRSYFWNFALQDFRANVDRSAMFRMKDEIRAAHKYALLTFARCRIEDPQWSMKELQTLVDDTWAKSGSAPTGSFYTDTCDFLRRINKRRTYEIARRVAKLVWICKWTAKRNLFQL